MQVRWISNSRRATQRLGFCKAVASLAGPARTRAEMVDAVRTTVCKLFEVPYSPDLESWLNARGSLSGRAAGGQLELEAQAYYIWLHPSHSGWLSPKGIGEYVEVLPRKMLILDDVFRPTEAGTILANVLMGPEDRDAWIRPNTGHNPLLLTPGQQYYFSHLVLSADGDFLIPWMGRLVSRFGLKRFSYLDAGEEIPAVLAGLVAAFEPVADLSSDRRFLASADNTRAKIENEIQVERHKDGSGSRREQTSVPRLEWMVDLGVLRRDLVEPFTYSFTASGATAARTIDGAYAQAIRRRYADKVLGSVLDEDFARAFSPMLWEEATALEGIDQPGDFLDFIRPAYDAVAGYSGYCLLRPLLVLAATLARGAGRRVQLEYSSATQLLESAFRQDPAEVRYTIDRFATDYQVRLESKRPASR